MSEADDSSFDSKIGSYETRLMLVRWARRKGVAQNDCDDIASETIVQAYQSKASFNSARASLPTWLKGIEKHVIEDYFRRTSTQKRNAPGGLISLDDVPPEPGHENTRQVEHDVVDRANLSKKERDAVDLSLRGAEKHEVARRVSSSAKHRAAEKIEQVRSDDRFQEQPHGPDTVECAYGKINRNEHDTALLYDWSRRTSWFVDAISDWRKTPEWNEVQSNLRSERTHKRFPLNVTSHNWPEGLFRYYRKANERSPQLRRRVAAAIEIVLAFPEWPSVGYCRLDSNERRRRLEEFGWLFGSEPFWEITEREFDIFIGAVSASASEPPASSDLSAFLEMINKAPQSGSDVYSSTHLIRVDWRFPPKSIVNSFAKWAAVAQKQKSDIPRVQSAGRPRTGILLGYALNRLTTEFGMSARSAFSWLKKNYGAPVATSPERIKRTAKRARDALKDYLPAPAEIGL
jgi:DNA-directed RNA polymerase specialized sigma24 family protein